LFRLIRQTQNKERRSRATRASLYLYRHWRLCAR